MKLLISKHDDTKAILLAFEEDDVKTLHILHDNSLVFGMYLVWFRNVTNDESTEKLSEQIQPIVSKYPLVKAIAFLNITKGFVPTETKEINNELGI